MTGAEKVPLSCPFCEGAAEADTMPSVTGRQHFVSCKVCTCYGYNYQPFTTYARKSEAIAAWNRRARVEAGDEDVRAAATALCLMVERGRGDRAELLISEFARLGLQLVKVTP